jgi:hypothetical protein
LRSQKQAAPGPGRFEEDAGQRYDGNASGLRLKCEVEANALITSK